MSGKKTGKRPPIKTRTKTTPIISLTGMPPQAKKAWWSQRFIEVLESFKMGSRLARGKAYAQEAKVLKLSISSGVVTATVQGSKKQHYKVSIQLEPLADNQWRQVMQNLTGKAIYAVEMLGDQMPEDIEEVFHAANVSLFPSVLEELESSCDCPDWSNPCKHIAATYYILAQHFDLDPFLIFVWRGRLKTQIIEYLRGNWRQGKPRTQAFTTLPVRKIDQTEYEHYWYGSSDVTALPSLDPLSRSVATTYIEKLGPAPVQIDEKELGEILSKTYEQTSDIIRAWITETQVQHPELIAG